MKISRLALCKATLAWEFGMVLLIIGIPVAFLLLPSFGFDSIASRITIFVLMSLILSAWMLSGLALILIIYKVEIYG